MDLTDKIIKEEVVQEASYRMNIGFAEMAQFYQMASTKEIKTMERIVKSENWIAFKKLIKKVLSIDLK